MLWIFSNELWELANTKANNRREVSMLLPSEFVPLDQPANPAENKYHKIEGLIETLKQPAYATAFYRHMLDLYMVKKINLLNSIPSRFRPNEQKGAPSEGEILSKFLKQIEFNPEIPIKDWSSPREVAKRFVSYYKRTVGGTLKENVGKTLEAKITQHLQQKAITYYSSNNKPIRGRSDLSVIFACSFPGQTTLNFVADTNKENATENNDATSDDE